MEKAAGLRVAGERETPFRYRVVPPSFGRLFSVTFWLLVCVVLLHLLMVCLYLGGLAILGLLLGEPGIGYLATLTPVLALADMVIVPMLALYVLMRWGRFVGAQLAFVRRHPLDTAIAKGLYPER